MDINKIKMNSDYILIDEDTVDSIRNIDESRKENLVDLPESRDDYYPETGIVLMVGPGIYDKKLEKFIEINIKPGQRVMFHQRAGQKFHIDSKSYRLLHDSDIVAYF